MWNYLQNKYFYFAGMALPHGSMNNKRKHFCARNSSDFLPLKSTSKEFFQLFSAFSEFFLPFIIYRTITDATQKEI